MPEYSPKWVVEGVLARSCRPGYPGKDVQPAMVASVVGAWRRDGVKSIICLLDASQLAYYNGIPTGLIGYYRDKGFQVAHIPVTDYKYPPLDKDELALVQQAFDELPKPVLVHCSAGVDRTGLCSSYLTESKAG